MASAIRVKVRVATVIAILTAKTKEIQKAVEEYPKAKAKYKKDLAAWHKSVVSKVRASTIQDVSVYAIRDNPWVEIKFDIPKGVTFPDAPKEPTNPTSRQYINGEWTEGAEKEIAELEQTIRILGMTEDEFVPASVMKEIHKYL